MQGGGCVVRFAGTRQSCFDPHMDFPEIGRFVFRVVNARQ